MQRLYVRTAEESLAAFDLASTSLNEKTSIRPDLSAQTAQWIQLAALMSSRRDSILDWWCELRLGGRDQLFWYLRSLRIYER